MKTKIVVATIKSWNIENARKFKKRHARRYEVIIIDKKEALTYEKLRRIGSRYVFIPHWSWIIPKNVCEGFECVIFHMTELPYGRGGSPLQNLISRGFRRTTISAIRAVKALDAGPIYIKRPLNLEGKASDIFQRASDIIFNDMIPRIIEDDIRPLPQKGRPVIFLRRKPSDGDISRLKNTKKIYDRIRMLDAESYPPAYLKVNG